MSIPDIIQKMHTSGHPHINLSSLYTYLWCLWKPGNNLLFDRKLSRPTQVYPAANAIIQGTNLEKTTSKGDHQLAQPDKHLQTPSPYPLEKDSDLFAGNAIFCDASWSSATGKAGIGVIIYMQANQHCQQVQVSALAPQAFSPLQTEAHAMHLAAKLAGLLHIQDTHFYTDCSVLASAVASTDIFAAPSHWEVRPLMAQIQSCPAFQRNRVAHIHRSGNVKAHHQARLAMKIQSTSLAIRCLSSGAGQCPGKTILADVSCVLPYTLLFVKCS
jgi:ribonuclease HI